MFRMLIDTCVWLDLAKDTRQHPVLGVVEEMVRQGLMTLIVPQVVIDEFRRNRDRIEKESVKSLRSHVQVVKEAIGAAGGDSRKTKSVLAHIDDVAHKIPLLGGAAVGALDRIETLLTAGEIVLTSPDATLRAAARAIEKRAPFHRDKNSMADALIIEVYGERVRSERVARTRFAFITHNKWDFSLVNGNHKLPHPDISDMFSKIKSMYFINLAEALRRVDPTVVTETMYEYSIGMEVRGLTEILAAEDLLMHQVWYNRHWNRRIAIEEGRIKLVDREDWEGASSNTIVKDIWAGALRAQKRVERQYGKSNLGPWDDFEWGMINGKLSALRWALGDEWDMLDT